MKMRGSVCFCGGLQGAFLDLGPAAGVLGRGVSLQSNSATVGIIMLLAREGLVELPVCLFMMLGCNIGCTMSATLASVGCKKDAKRAAMVHMLFNLTGTIICAILFCTAGDYIVDFFMQISGNDSYQLAQ